MGIEMTFEITFQSNYHVGAGYGKGFGLDSALLREADGTLVLRGSALTGLLRGSAYQLFGLEPLRRHAPDDPLARLFGDPKQAKRWHIASAHPVTRQAKDSQPVQRIRIDPRTRRAEPRKLFSQEEGHAGQVFRFTVTCATSDNASLDDASLLVAAARNVRALGRSRRRGVGECIIHLVGFSGIDDPKPESWEDWFLDRFDRFWLRGNPAPFVQVDSKAELPAISVSDGATARVRIIVRLDEPVIVAERAPAGNQFDTLPYIPGGVVLGALAGKVAECCDLANPDEYHDFVALFLRGGMIFPTLYTAYEYCDNLYPTIPGPLGLMTCSVVPFEEGSEGHGAYPAGRHKECPRCPNRLEPVGGFVVLKRDKPYTHLPGRSSELHTKVKEETQRVENGQLYSYTVLNAGQYFVGELLCADEAAWNRLKEMTGIVEKKPLSWRMGKARRRGYGQVTAWLERCDSHPPIWIQLSIEQRVPDPTQSLSLTLLTDAIISNPFGQQATGFVAEWLEPILGLGPLEIQKEKACARARVVDSFKAYLGLPRWRDAALTAGSVVWFKLQSPPDHWQERLYKLEAEGIGLRRSEGYGRVAFNHPIYDLCRGVENSAIPLDREMRLGIGPDKDTFMAHWEGKLEKLPERLDLRFAALARWLHAHSGESPENLLDHLSGFGQPDSALVAAIGGQDEYGNRRKDSFFIKEGKDGIRAVRDVLEYLKKENQQDWLRGIERLADWVAALTEDKKGGVR
ncbi:MAG: RAMP superfamily CRISPR-associated protein [Thermodesulfobacteriota bacterium]